MSRIQHLDRRDVRSEQTLLLQGLTDGGGGTEGKLVPFCTAALQGLKLFR